MASVLDGTLGAMGLGGTPSSRSPCLEWRVLSQVVFGGQVFQSFAVFLAQSNVTSNSTRVELACE